jgi:hypothetical protein
MPVFHSTRIYSHIPLFYQAHMGSKDHEIAEHRARVLPFARLAQILGV